jgi:hypothetical protein
MLLLAQTTQPTFTVTTVLFAMVPIGVLLVSVTVAVIKVGTFLWPKWDWVFSSKQRRESNEGMVYMAQENQRKLAKEVAEAARDAAETVANSAATAVAELAKAAAMERQQDPRQSKSCERDHHEMKSEIQQLLKSIADLISEMKAERAVNQAHHEELIRMLMTAISASR